MAQASSEPTTKRRGRPALVSRAAILDAALTIVDTQGLDALTMRRLGATLGIDPMTIYHHLPDKSALFDGLVERAFAEIVIPAPTGQWQDDVRAIARAARTAFLAHPNVVQLVATRPPVTEAAFALVEAVTAIFLRAGFDPQRAADGFDVLGRLVTGHVLAQAGDPPGGEEVDGGEQQHEETQRQLPIDRYPSLAAVTRAGVGHDPERLFELALDGLILALSVPR